MSFTKEDILAALGQQEIDFELYEHEEVLTVEAMAKVLKDAAAAPPAKNLFLKDKRNRLYLVTALPNTKIDLKGLSARLGTGKGGVRMAPDELVQKILQVTAGAVTPFAACQPAASNVVLLLDKKLKDVGRFCVHPLVNTASVSISAEGLEKLLLSQGRETVFVDFENAPVIDNEHPPDLKSTAEAAQPFDIGVETVPVQSSVHSKKNIGEKKDKGKKTSNLDMLCDDPLSLTESLMAKICSTELAEGTIANQLKADIEMEITSFRNASYTRGYLAAKNQISQMCNPNIQ